MLKKAFAFNPGTFEMKHWLIKIILIIGCSLILPACAFVPYRGYVVDADTKEPVKDVVVFVKFVSAGFPGGGRYVSNASECLSDEKGYFSLPDKWPFNPFTSDDITIFKSGYVPIPGRWDQLKDLTYEPYIVNAKVVWKVEYGKPYILLKKASMNREKRLDDIRGIYTSGVPTEKRKLLDNEIQKEYELFLPCKRDKTC